MHRYSPVLVVEDGDEFKTSTKGFEVLAKRRDAYIVGMFELGDSPLSHVESTGKLCLTDRLSVTELIEADLFERLATKLGKTFGGSGACNDLGTEFGKLRSGHQINPSFFSSSR
jgi:hypothetical protein